MVDWNKTNLREFLRHEKCRQSEACQALAGFNYATDSMLEVKLMKLWISHNLLSNLSFQSTEEFIDLAVANGLTPPWLDFAISNKLYKPKTDFKVPITVQTTFEIASKQPQSRRDLLTPIIEQAVNEVGGYDLAKVFLQLKEMALSSSPPFYRIHSGAKSSLHKQQG